MILLDGRKIGEEKMLKLQERVSNLSIVPKLAIVRVGNREDSKIYIERKVEFAKKIGAETEVFEFPEGVSEESVISDIYKLNDDSRIHGIIVQLPLPEHIDVSNVINAISPYKDVDGLTSINIGKLMRDEHGIIPATPKGILSLLDAYDISVEGKNVVVVGRSILVGKSVAILMSNHNATVTMCHSKTTDLAEKTKTADILIVAIGKQKFITKDYLSEGQVIVDVGISSDGESRIVGDVDFEDVKDVVSAISRVPGGVGPMTVASLFENLIEVAEKK